MIIDHEKTMMGESSPDPATTKTGGGEGDGDDYTATIPKALLGGKGVKPGDEVILRVVKDHGDEVEVAYATAHETEEAPAESSPDQQLDALAKA